MANTLEHALALAARGFYVFRLAENTKKPIAGVPWQADSTINPAKIKGWYAALAPEDDYNIGIDCEKSGLAVIDIDIKPATETAKEKRGDISLRMLQTGYDDFPETLMVSTISKGFHYYFWDKNIKSTQSDLAPDIDTRAIGGYVVAPGSTIGGVSYKIIKEAPVAALPEWVGRRMAMCAPNTETYTPTDVELDTDATLSAAAWWLQNKAKPALEGNGGDAHTFWVACKVKDHGVSQEMALDLMLEHWNEKCEPPWNPDELQQKVRNAYRYGKKPIGIATPEAEFDAVAPTPVVPKIGEYARPLRKIKATEFARREWLLGYTALVGNLTVLVAPPGVGKSTLSILMAMSLASGRDLLGLGHVQRCAVAIHNNEDSLEEMERRLLAAMEYYGLTYEDFEQDGKQMLFLTSGECKNLSIAIKTGAEGTIRSLVAEQIVAEFKALDIKMWIVDPFSESHCANENDNIEILQISKIYRGIAQQAKCAVMLVHHDRKPGIAGSEGSVGNMYSARGASSLVGVARIVLTFHTMTEKEAKKLGIEAKHRFRYARLDFAKANMSLNSGEPLWFERKSVIIGASEGDPDGESVGVLVPVQLAVKEESPNAANITLAKDVEALVADMGSIGLAISAIAEELVHSFPMHANKKPATLGKAIRRLFDTSGRIASLGGDLEMYESDAGGKAKIFVRLISDDED